MLIGLFSDFSTIIFRFFVLIFWLIFYQKIEFKKINKQVIQYFIIYTFLFFLSGVVQVSVSNNAGLSRLVYSIFWSVISIYGFCYLIFFLIGFYQQKNKRILIYVISIIALSIPTLAAAIMMHLKRTYSPINTVDFFNIIIQLFISIVIINRILIEEQFQKNIESFFVFSGFILYFGLHIMASNVINLDFLQNWNFAKAATIVSLIYWLGSVLLSWRIRSKYL